MLENSLDNHIISFNKKFSAGVEKENIVTAAFAHEHLNFAESCTTPQTYYEQGFSSAYIEYPAFLKDFTGKHLKVLDVGVGRGESSVMLASKGHKVFSVEPSYEFCRLIAFLGNKFSLDITPVCTIGEEMSEIKEKNFDLVIFNSSLHHCDDPVRALRQAYEMLKPGGKILLCSEIQIKPWVNKAKWYKRLETHPEEMGHYGGNEHAYYNWEYKSMLKSAGFSKVLIRPSNLFLNPLARVMMDLKSDYLKSANLKRQTRYLIKIIYYFTMAYLCRINFLYSLLSRWSVAPGQYEASKV